MYYVSFSYPSSGNPSKRIVFGAMHSRPDMQFGQLNVVFVHGKVIHICSATMHRVTFFRPGHFCDMLESAQEMLKLN